MSAGIASTSRSGRWARFAGFLGAIVNTMQNWNDSIPCARRPVLIELVRLRLSLMREG